MALRADRPGKLGRRAPGAAADVERALAGPGVGGGERHGAEALDAALDAVVGAQPHRAAGAFPIGRLLGRQRVLALHALLPPPPCAWITISRGM
jgi:hypothetical protein